MRAITATPAVGEQAEVADADQPLRQNVDEESAQELISRDGHDLLLAAVGIVLPAERDALVFESHQAMVGDGDAMSVAGQIAENMFGTAEGRLGIDDPVLAKKLPEEWRKRSRSQRAAEVSRGTEACSGGRVV